MTWYEVTWVFFKRERNLPSSEQDKFKAGLERSLWSFYDRRVSANGDLRYAHEVVFHLDLP